MAHKAVNRSGGNRGFCNPRLLVAARLPWAFAVLTHVEGLVIKIKYTSEYAAGVTAGFGLASFCLFLVAVGTGTLSGYRLAAAVLGLLLIVFSIVWKLRMEKGG